MAQQKQFSEVTVPGGLDSSRTPAPAPQLGLVLLLAGSFWINPLLANEPGNELGRSGLEPGVPLAADGLNIFYDNNSRSPFGLLYGPFRLPPEFKPATDNELLYRGYVDGGYLWDEGETGGASYLEYGDLKDGWSLRQAGFSLIDPNDGRYLDLIVGTPDRDDRFFQLQAGRHGAFEMALAFKGTPHVLSTQAKSLWDGAGTDRLVLPAGIESGVSSAAEIRNAILQRPFTQLNLQRDETSVTLQYDLNRRWQLFGELSSETKEGARPFGGAFAYPGLGQVHETIEPVDYRTTDFQTGLRLVRDSTQANLVYSGSFFRNEFESLTFDNAGLPSIQGFYLPPQGQFSLPPDNNAHRLRFDLATRWQFLSSRFNTTLAFHRAEQDEALLPPTIASGTGGSTLFPIDLEQWNSVAALSRSRADLQTDTKTATARYSLRPFGGLGVQFEAHWRDEDNNNDYEMRNPITGQYGFPALDGGLGVFLPGRDGIYHPGQPGSRVRIRAMPAETDQAHVDASFDYRLASGTRLNLRLRQARTEYAARERDRIDDEEIRLQLSDRLGDRTSVRLSYTWLDREGDSYDPNPYERFYSSSLPDYDAQFPGGSAPHTLSSLRKYDLADKIRQSARAVLHTMLTDRSDIQLSANFTDDEFDALHGLDGATSLALNAEWTTQFAKTANLFLYYSYLAHDRRVNNINDTGRIGSDGSPGGIVYPLDRAWQQNASEKTHAAGSGYEAQLGRFTLRADYSYAYSDSALGYDYASTRAFNGIFPVAQAGQGYDDQVFTSHIFDVRLSWPVADQVSASILYRYEREDLDDYHYQGLTDPVINNSIYLLAVPEDFEAHLLGLFLKFDF